MTEERHHFLLLVKNKKWNQVEDFLIERHASEAADFFKALELPLQSFVFRLLPHKFSAKLFTYLSVKDQNNLLKKMSQPEVKRILADLNPDDRTELFSGLPPKIAKKFLTLLNSEDLRETKQLLEYPEHTVGRLMTPDFITLKPGWTVGESLKYVREKGASAETVDETLKYERTTFFISLYTKVNNR